MTQTTDRDQKTEEQERTEETLRRLAAAIQECRVTREAWGVACRATDRARNSRERVERRVDERIARIAHTRACYRWWKLERGTMTQTTDRDQKTEEQQERPERPEETLRRLAARARHLLATTKDCHHVKGVEFFLEEVAALTTGSAE